jgi:hypothetical protein
MAVLGLRGTGDWGTDERPKDFRESILWRQPNGQSPLTALMGKMGSEKAKDPEFFWWEESLNTVRVQSTVVKTNAETTLTLAAGGDNLVPGDLLMVEKADSVVFDNEIVEVTASTATSATVTRGASATTAAAIPANAYLTKIGNVFAEGTGAPIATTRNPTKDNNYVQIFKTTYEMTNTAKGINNLRTGDPLKNDKKRKMFDHSIMLEWAFMFGRKSETSGANGKPKRTTAGLRQFIKTNVTIFGDGSNGTKILSADTFNAAVSPVFDWNTGAGSERLILCGNAALNAMNRVARAAPGNNINHVETVKVYGMDLQKWSLPQGTFYFKTHPLMNLHPIYNAAMFVLDPSSIKYRYLRDTDFKDNIQANDSDTQKGQWLTEAGLEVHNEAGMAYLGNVQ